MNLPVTILKKLKYGSLRIKDVPYNCCYNTAAIVFRTLKELGLIDYKVVGNERWYYLTDLGKKYLEVVESVDGSN